MDHFYSLWFIFLCNVKFCTSVETEDGRQNDRNHKKKEHFFVYVFQKILRNLGINTSDIFQVSINATNTRKC